MTTHTATGTTTTTTTPAGLVIGGEVPVLADGMVAWRTDLARTQAAEIETLRAQVQALQVDNAYLEGALTRATGGSTAGPLPGLPTRDDRATTAA